jgi:hypothetical protein
MGKMRRGKKGDQGGDELPQPPAIPAWEFEPDPEQPGQSRIRNTACTWHGEMMRGPHHGKRFPVDIDPETGHRRHHLYSVAPDRLYLDHEAEEAKAAGYRGNNFSGAICPQCTQEVLAARRRRRAEDAAAAAAASEAPPTPEPPPEEERPS